jgi:broad specificity phosphatase PhoE
LKFHDPVIFSNLPIKRFTIFRLFFPAEEYKNWAWHDSRLTDLGKEQASSVRPSMEKYQVDIVFVSPLSRAILTGILAIPEGPRFVVEDDIRERIGTHPCDKRRSKKEIKADFPIVDVETLETEEDNKWSEAREPWDDLILRAERVLHKIKNRPENHIALVTHNDFLQALLLDYQHLHVTDPSIRRKFKNAEHLPLILTWDDAAPVVVTSSSESA